MPEAATAEEVRPPFGRTRHPYFMHEMIRRQPVALQATLALGKDSVAGVPAPAAGRPVLFVGTGTSYHAAEATARTAEENGFAPGLTQARTAFEVANDPDRFRKSGAAVFFSASGETRVTNEALTDLRGRKVPTILITATERGPASALADHVLLSRYADETSWTHTVSYTCALALGQALLDHWKDGGKEPPWDADALQEAAVAALALENIAVEFIDQLSNRSEVVLTGNGSAETTAKEGALKLREASGRFAAVNGTEELLHGTLPSVGGRCAVVALSRTARERDRALSGLRASATVGALPLLIDSSGEEAEAPGVTVWPVRGLGTGSLPILQVIPLQLLAYWLAVSDGRNPDVMGLEDPKYLEARRSFRI